MLDLKEMTKEAFDNAEKREIRTETIPMLRRCSSKICKTIEDFCFWKYKEDVSDEFKKIAKQSFTYELTDIITCILVIADTEKFDIEKTLLEVMKRNKKRAEKLGKK